MPEMIGNTVNAASVKNDNQEISREQAIQDGRTLSKSKLDEMSQFIYIKNNQYVLQVPNNSKISSSDINKEQEILTVFNRMVKENGAVLIPDDSNNVSPFVSFVKRSRHHKRYHKIDIVGYGSNGYCYRDRHGNFHYRVTKSIGQATWDTIVYGWSTTDVG